MHICGRCAAYCPVGAIKYCDDLDDALRDIRTKSITGAYVEPEALAALSEGEGISYEYIVAALKYLGISKVYLYSPITKSLFNSGQVVAASPAEEVILKRNGFKEVVILKIDIPPNSLYITQCVAWKSINGLKVITSREIQKALRTLNYEVLEPSNLNEVVGFENMVKLSRGTVFRICPGGCLLGGGQPISRNEELDNVLSKRIEVYKKIINDAFSNSVNDVPSDPHLFLGGEGSPPSNTLPP